MVEAKIVLFKCDWCCVLGFQQLSAGCWVLGVGVLGAGVLGIVLKE